MVIWLQNPFDNLPGEGFRKMRYQLMAEAFLRLGHTVVYWTSDFSHGRKVHRDLGDASCIPSGCTMRLIKTLPYENNVSFARIRSHLAYARTWERESRKEVAAGTLPRPQIIISSFPTISGSAATLRLARRFGAKSVVDVQDAWPETFERILPRIVLLPLRLMARRIFRRANLVTGVCDRYRALVGRDDYVRAYLGIELTGEERPRAERTGKKLAYIGGLGRTYDLATVRSAAAELGMELAIAGGTNPLGAADLERFLAGCDVGVIPMPDDSWVGLPNKIFDYAKAGLPIVSSLSGESAALLREYGCGATYRTGDVASLVAAVREALKMSGENARRLCEERFEARQIYDAYAQTLTDLFQ